MLSDGDDVGGVVDDDVGDADGDIVGDVGTPAGYPVGFSRGLWCGNINQCPEIATINRSSNPLTIRRGVILRQFFTEESSNHMSPESVDRQILSPSTAAASVAPSDDEVILIQSFTCSH
jgi:hypothetical protein